MAPSPGRRASDTPALILAQQALEIASKTHTDLQVHVVDCSGRYNALKQSVDAQGNTQNEIRSFLARMFWGLLAVLLSVLGVAVVNLLHLHT